MDRQLRYDKEDVENQCEILKKYKDHFSVSNIFGAKPLLNFNVLPKFITLDRCDMPSQMLFFYLFGTAK